MGGAARVSAAVAALAVALAACDREPVAELAESAEAAARPPRVVALTPLASRFAVALGVGPFLIAVDSASAELEEMQPFAPAVADDLAGAAALSPDFVLAGELPSSGDPSLRALRSAGAEVFAFAPHDLEDVYAATREIGAALAGSARALELESGIARPLGIVGGSSPETDRPRVVGIASLEPLELAGGHSFETDLIEIAGGTSVTHGGDDVRLPATPERIASLAPELAIVFTRAPLDDRARQRARDALPRELPVDFFACDLETFWLRAPAEDARRLQVLVAEWRRALRDPTVD